MCYKKGWGGCNIAKKKIYNTLMLNDKTMQFSVFDYQPFFVQAKTCCFFKFHLLFNNSKDAYSANNTMEKIRSRA